MIKCGCLSFVERTSLYSRKKTKSEIQPSVFSMKKPLKEVKLCNVERHIWTMIDTAKIALLKSAVFVNKIKVNNFWMLPKRKLNFLQTDGTRKKNCNQIIWSVWAQKTNWRTGFENFAIFSKRYFSCWCGGCGDSRRRRCRAFE